METISCNIQNQIATLSITSPPANALSSTILQDLNDQLNELEHDRQVKVILLKGEGRFFSAGADIKEFTSFQQSADYESLGRKGQELFSRIESFPIPVIAVIHGAALGGGLELAMSCHIRLVTKSAKLGLPELTLGIIPGFAGTQRLPQYVGTAKAYELLLTGEPISGEEACRLGLANHAYEENELLEEADKLATKIAAKSKPSVERIMKLVPYAKTSQFDTGATMETKMFGEIFGSDDAKEGVQAFLEKRKPNFHDK
ncbi:enoyl-CoA hydratase [Ornithinibacillus gellani]|uniref:enoyl-CoA hydratase n=1 Tax=Ornithinibacillus gellani TaxID=2293253 RepID=UPI000F48B146|nr:enoyl-CoA hydratase [Ornithinibacillus gellani]TQS76144.1 enoyl-CoA hydratase [Ornithinibacillus gellani]